MLKGYNKKMLCLVVDIPKTLMEYDSSSNTGRLSFISVMETVIVAVDDLFPVPVSWAITWRWSLEFAMHNW